MCYCVTVQFNKKKGLFLFELLGFFVISASFRVNSHCKLWIICLDCSSITLDYRIWTVTVWIPVDFFVALFLPFVLFVSFAFRRRATLVCHVAIALCNIYSLRTGNTNFIDVMSLTFRDSVSSLVLSNLGVTKPSLLCHIKRVFQVTLLVSVKLRIYGVLLLRFTLN